VRRREARIQIEIRHRELALRERVRIERSARFEHDHGFAGAREGARRNATARAAADHDHVGVEAFAVARFTKRQFGIGRADVVTRPRISDARPRRIRRERRVAFGIAEVRAQTFERGETAAQRRDRRVRQPE
jgi:hypothetical protein